VVKIGRLTVSQIGRAWVIVASLDFDVCEAGIYTERRYNGELRLRRQGRWYMLLAETQPQI